MTTGNITVHVQASGVPETVAELESVKMSMEAMEAQAALLNTAMSGMKMGAMAGGVSLIAMVAPMIMASKAAAGFDSNMRRIVALGGGEFKANINTMTDQAITWSTTYGQSLDDISSSMIELVKTGYSYNEVMSMSQPVLQLATANQIESAMAVQVVNQEMKLWGEEMGYTAAQLAELSHQAATMSAMDIAQLPEMLRYVGSSTAIAGITIEQFLAMAGGLSQIGALFGESFGTFFQRLYVSGEELSDIFGVDGLVTNGVVDFQVLMEIMRKGADDPELWAQAMEVWGVRAGRAMSQIHKAAKSVDEIYGALNKDGKTLSDAATVQAESLEALWARLSAVFVAPFNTQEVMNAMRDGLTSIKDALSSEAFSNALATIITQSAQFVENYGPLLMNIIVNLMITFSNLMPVLGQVAYIFSYLLSVVASIPAPVWVFVLSLYAMTKLVPALMLVYNAIWSIGMATLEGSLNAKMMAMSVAGIVGGLLLMVSSTDPVVRGLGAIAFAIGMVTAAYQLMAIAKGASEPWMVPAMIAGAAAMAAAFGLMTPQMPNISTSALPTSNNLGQYNPGNSNTYNYGDTTYNINGVGNNNDAVNMIIQENMEG